MDWYFFEIHTLCLQLFCTNWEGIFLLFAVNLFTSQCLLGDIFFLYKVKIIITLNKQMGSGTRQHNLLKK